LPFFMEVSMNLVHPQKTLLHGTLHFLRRRGAHYISVRVKRTRNSLPP